MTTIPSLLSDSEAAAAAIARIAQLDQAIAILDASSLSGLHLVAVRRVWVAASDLLALHSERGKTCGVSCVLKLGLRLDERAGSAGRPMRTGATELISAMCGITSVDGLLEIAESLLAEARRKATS